MIALQRVEAALRAAGSRRVGKNWCCPAHEDSKPSLSVGNGDGKVLLRCWKDCKTEDVVRALGLEMRHLFDDAQESRRIVARYPYTDEAGKLLYEVVRYEPKDFRQRRPDGKGGWSWKLGDVRRVLYRLPEVIAAVQAGDSVYVVEGESDVDALHDAMKVATCNSGGAGRWRPDYSEFLRGADVIVVADKDDPGLEHARQVHASLEDIARSVRHVEPREGKDAADHLKAGFGVDDFIEVDLEDHQPDRVGGEHRDVGPEDDHDQVPEHLTDMGNARRFARQHVDSVRYCADEKVWRIWDGRRWEIDDTEQVVQFAKQTVIAIYAEALRDSDGEMRGKLAKHAAASESASKLGAMIELAQSEPEVVARTADFDTHTHLFNVLNGTLDLDSLELRPHRREDLLTKLAPVEYDPEARSDLWNSVIERAVPDKEGRRFLQKSAGYMLLGEKREDIVLLVHGPPASAKGTVQQAIASTLGEYAITAELDALAERHRAGGPRPELVRLRGSRMVSIYESSRRLKLDAALLKTLTGSDPVTARGMYSSPITFMPQFVLVVASNYRPNLPEDDDAVWRRVRELPFVTQIPEAERDPAVRQELTDPAISGAAILAWAVEGLRMLREEGFTPPEIVQRATADYRSEMDDLAPFFDDVCVFDSTTWTSNSNLRAALERWCSEMGERTPRMKDVATKLRAHGCTPERKYAGRGWAGVALLHQGDAAEHDA